MFSAALSNLGLKTLHAPSRLIQQAPNLRAWWPWLLLAGGLRLYAALTTPGFYHPDEHFQTLEFAHAKLGGISPELLPWEYRSQIRPFFQPGLYYLLAQGAQGVGLDDPFDWVRLFRLSSAFLAWLGFLALVAAVPHWFQERREQKWAVIALTLTCYLPVLQARTSSENLGAAFFEVAILAAVLRRGHWAGLAAGAAFLARYQLGFAIAGLGAWLLWQKRYRELAYVCGGVLLMIGVGAVIDRWGYGEWVFAPWNYVRVNLLEGKASEFGERPFWAYLGIVWHDLPKPFGGLVFIALLISAVRAPQHILVWTMVPFVLGHLVIAHKETRFLFPFLFVAPVLAILAISGLKRWAESSLARVGWAVLLALNGWWLLVGHHGQLLGGRWLEVLRDADPAGETALYYNYEHPYGGPVIYFHLLGPNPERAQQHDLEKISQLPRPFFYFRHSRHNYPPENLTDGCQRLYRDPPITAWFPDLPWEAKALRRSFDVQTFRDLFICR